MKSYGSNIRSTDVSIEVMQLQKFDYHYSNDLRILWIVDGQIKIDFTYGSNILYKNSIEIINIGEPVCIVGSADNIVMIISINGNLCLSRHVNLDCRILNVQSSSFFKKGKYYNHEMHMHHIEVLRDKILELLYYMTLNNCIDSYKCKVLLFKLLDFLVASFDDIAVKLLEIPRISKEHIQRFIDIDTYMLKNLSKKIKLEELASLKYISAQYLSTEFRKKLNHSFSKIIEYYRTVHAVRLLIGSDLTIGDIAEESGFSDMKYFYRAVKKTLGCTPSDFRKKLSQKNVYLYRVYDKRLVIEELLSKYSLLNQRPEEVLTHIFPFCKKYADNVYCLKNEKAILFCVAGPKSLDIVIDENKKILLLYGKSIALYNKMSNQEFILSIHENNGLTLNSAEWRLKTLSKRLTMFSLEW